MKTQYAWALAAALTAAGCSGGQSRNAVARTVNPGAAQPVTLIGCLVAGGTGTPGSAVGTAGNTGAPAFTLIDTMTTTPAASAPGASAPASAPGASAPGTGAPAGSPSEGAANGAHAAVTIDSPKSYNLVGGNRDEMQRYANSRVEVRGTRDVNADTGTAGSSAAGTMGAAGSAGAAGAVIAVEQIQVSTVTQLDKTCNSEKR